MSDYPKHVRYAPAVAEAEKLTDPEAQAKALSEAFVTCRSEAEEKAVEKGKAVIQITRSAERVNYKFAGIKKA